MKSNLILFTARRYYVVISMTKRFFLIFFLPVSILISSRKIVNDANSHYKRPRVKTRHMVRIFFFFLDFPINVEKKISSRGWSAGAPQGWTYRRSTVTARRGIRARGRDGIWPAMMYSNINVVPTAGNEK